MYRSHRRFLPIVPSLAALVVLVALAASVAAAGNTGSTSPAGLAQVPVGGKVQADNACYVRLPSLPGARYGGFGAYNADTGVLAFAGGAEKRTEENTIAYGDLWAIKLDGSMSTWAPIPYSASSGYLRQTDRGCREMAVAQVSGSHWASVGGKDGCDGSTNLFGDVKELYVGAAADATEVRWVPNTGAILSSLPPVLAADRFRLARLFATYDTQRQRLILGQGSFDDERDARTRAEVYYATAQGSTWSIRQLHPAGEVPSRRYGTCAAYVYDPAQGLDGVFVLGGQEGAPPNTPATTYKEAWWLDFKDNAAGKWVNLSGRVANWDQFGYRREGACAYDPDSKFFYSWMGRANASIPDGASHSAGMWRVSLSQLGDATSNLTWERLAKDKLTGVTGMRLIPSVYDLKTKRFFALGGRVSLGEYTDVWAIYPDVTGDACTNLDPYAPFRNPTTPTPEPAPTATALPPQPEVCDAARAGVPAAVLSAAITSPSSVSGYGELCNPNAGASTFNHPRDRLSLELPGRPYHPLFNSLVWKCGCP